MTAFDPAAIRRSLLGVADARAGAAQPLVLTPPRCATWPPGLEQRLLGGAPIRDAVTDDARLLLRCWPRRVHDDGEDVQRHACGLTRAVRWSCAPQTAGPLD